MWFMKAGFLGTNFLIFYATFRSISWEYAEAAFIDGASHTGVLLKLMLPLASVTISAVALLSFIEFWNDWRVNVVYLPSYPLISYALYQFQNNPINEISTVPRKLAGCMLVIAPIMIMFIAFRNKLMGNITIGGLKG
jgi:raffinose/stachyose/melibiose transport system permease protein/N-acetylglucosamine transport system permease protein